MNNRMVLFFLGTLALAGCQGLDGLVDQDYDLRLRIDAVLPASGPLAGGNQVEILGANFDNNVRVFFGGQEADIEGREGDHRLRVIAPPGALGPAALRLERSGESAVLDAGYRYRASEMNMLFERTLPIAYGSSSKYVAGDFDGDGSLDIACQNPWNHFAVFLNSEGTFTETIDLQSEMSQCHEVYPEAANCAYEGKELVSADFNGDGLDDVLVVEQFHPVMKLVTGGSYAIEELDWPAGARVEPERPTLVPNRDVFLGDFDGDGRHDLAVIRHEGDEPTSPVEPPRFVSLDLILAIGQPDSRAVAWQDEDRCEVFHDATLVSTGTGFDHLVLMCEDTSPGEDDVRSLRLRYDPQETAWIIDADFPLWPAATGSQARFVFSELDDDEGQEVVMLAAGSVDIPAEGDYLAAIQSLDYPEPTADQDLLHWFDCPGEIGWLEARLLPGVEPFGVAVCYETGVAHLLGIRGHGTVSFGTSGLLLPFTRGEQVVRPHLFPFDLDEDGGQEIFVTEGSPTYDFKAFFFSELPGTTGTEIAGQFTTAPSRTAGTDASLARWFDYIFVEDRLSRQGTDLNGDGYFEMLASVYDAADTSKRGVAVVWSAAGERPRVQVSYLKDAEMLETIHQYEIWIDDFDQDGALDLVFSTDWQPELGQHRRRLRWLRPGPDGLEQRLIADLPEHMSSGRIRVARSRQGPGYMLLHGVFDDEPVPQTASWWEYRGDLEGGLDAGELLVADLPLDGGYGTYQPGVLWLDVDGDQDLDYVTPRAWYAGANLRRGFVDAHPHYDQAMTGPDTSASYLGAGGDTLHILASNKWIRIEGGETRTLIRDLEVPIVAMGAVCDLDGDGREDLMFSGSELGIFTALLPGEQEVARAQIWISPDLPRYNPWRWRLFSRPSPRTPGLTDLVIQQGWTAFHVENRSE